MNNVRVTLFFIYFLSACGGGGGGEAQPVVQTSTTASSSTSTASSSTSTSSNSSSSSASTNYTEFSNKSRVIDGYITGANVFIDFNFNLQQDAGEPSAVATSDAGVYEFDFDNGFSAITDFSNDCAKRRIQVAQVPVGATDSELGVVNKAYTMYHIPYGGNFVNITPFTGMFIDLLKDAKTELEESLGNRNNQSLAISVEDGCGSVANAMASKLATKSVTFANELNSKGYAILKDLYGDYIASFDNQNKQKAEKIVDFLKTADDIKAVVKTHFNNKYEPSVALSENATDVLFGDNNITAVPLSINIHHKGETDSDGWSDVMTYMTSGVKVLQNGKIAKSSCTEVDANNCELFDPTYANIKKNLDWYLTYGGSENKTIIDGTITSHFREAKETNDEGSTSCSQAAKLDLQGTKSCSGAGCPDSIRYEYEITHNKGFEALEGCDVTDNPYVYAFTQRVNSSTNQDDRYGLQYSLKDGSEIYNLPPTNFLGADKANVNYQNTFNKLEELFVSMDNINPVSAKLQDQEFISIFRNVEQKTDGNTTSGNRYDLVIEKGSSGLEYKCRITPWEASVNTFNFDKTVETTGNVGYTNCYNELISWNFHN